MLMHFRRAAMPWFEDVVRDVRQACRSLRRSPGFTVITASTTALGIAATTTLFSLAYGVLVRPLPWAEPDRLIRLEERRGGNAGRIPWTISNAAYLEWQGHAGTVEDVGGWRAVAATTMSDGGEAQPVQMAGVTPSLFRVLRAQPALGRLMVDADATSAQPDVILLSHGLWLRAFGGRADIVGHVVRIGDRATTVVGVMPRGFAFPDRQAEAWQPMFIAPVVNGSVRTLMIFSALARLRPGVAPVQAAAEASGRALGAPDVGPAGLALFGTNGAPALVAARAVDVLTADLRPSLLLLLAAVALLFVTAVASVVLLQMARAASRRREIAVRMAIGAGVGRVARGWMIESLVLAAVGGASGLALSWIAHRALPGLLPSDFPRLDDVRIDWRIALFAAGLTLISGVVCGLVPALQARRTSLVSSLGAHAAPADGRSRTSSARLRVALMCGQVAIACALIAGAGLLVRSFSALTRADRGYDPHNLVTARVSMPRAVTFQQKSRLTDAVRDRLGALPGVTEVGFGNALPFVTSGGFRGFNIPSPTHSAGNVQIQTIVRAVSPSFFKALRLRVLAGRALDDTDTATARPTIVVNRSFASQYLGATPVGTSIALNVGGHRDWEVVGVVEDMLQGGLLGRPPTRFGGIGEPLQPELFFAAAQWTTPLQELMLVARTSGDPAALTPTLRAVVREADPTVALDSVMTMDERVGASLARPRIYAVLLAAFAACALVIATVGLFGVLSYTTSRRTREIGVRTALGARPRDVATLVMREALGVAVAGAAAGVLLAFVLASSISTLLYGVSTSDPVSFTVAPAVLIVAALAACAIPARRAARLDPVKALRME